MIMPFRSWWCIRSNILAAILLEPVSDRSKFLTYNHSRRTRQTLWQHSLLDLSIRHLVRMQPLGSIKDDLQALYENEANNLNNSEA